MQKLWEGLMLDNTSDEWEIEDFVCANSTRHQVYVVCLRATIQDAELVYGTELTKLS